MEKCTLELSFTKLEMTKELSPSMATLGSFSLPLTTTTATSSFLYTFSHALKAKISLAMRCIFTFYYWQRSMDEILDLLPIIYPILYLQKIYHWLVSGMDWKMYEIGRKWKSFQCLFSILQYLYHISNRKHLDTRIRFYYEIANHDTITRWLFAVHCDMKMV